MNLWTNTLLRQSAALGALSRRSAEVVWFRVKSEQGFEAHSRQVTWGPSGLLSLFRTLTCSEAAYNLQFR